MGEPHAHNPASPKTKTHSKPLANHQDQVLTSSGHAQQAETLIAPRPQPPIPNAAEPHAHNPASAKRMTHSKPLVNHQDQVLTSPGHAHQAEALIAPRPQPPIPCAAEPHAHNPASPKRKTHSKPLVNHQDQVLTSPGHAHQAETLLAPRPQPAIPCAADPHATEQEEHH